MGPGVLACCVLCSMTCQANCACLMQNWPDVMFQLQSVAGEAVLMHWHCLACALLGMAWHVHDAGLLSLRRRAASAK